MNKFEIIIEEFYDQLAANDGVNQFIQDCTDSNQEIIDITSHIIEEADGDATYVFIYKVSTEE